MQTVEVKTGSEEIRRMFEERPDIKDAYKAYYQAGYAAAIAEMMKFIMYLQDKKVTPPDLLT